MICLIALALACGGDDPKDPEDKTPPTVQSTAPADSAENVEANTDLIVVFSEIIDSNSVNAGTVTISGGITATFSYAGSVVTISPTTDFDFLTLYTVTLSTGIKDAAGNAMSSAHSWTFTTENRPAPTVISTVPTDGARQISATDPITATFSRVMDATTLTTSSVVLNDGSTDVAGAVSVAGATVTYTPADTLDYATEYTMSISTLAADTFGLALESPYVWRFTTEDDPLSPVVTISSPEFGNIIGDSVTVVVDVTPIAPDPIDHVEFYINGFHQVAGDDFAAPYEYNLVATSFPLGTPIAITAKAYDTGGREGNSIDIIEALYQWEEIATDINDPWPVDITRILARSTDSLLEFRYEFGEPWEDPYDSVPDDTALDLAIYMDTDQSVASGKIEFDGTPLNGIGADYRVIIGVHGDTALGRYVSGTTWDKEYGPEGFTHYDVPAYSTFLEFGMKWSDIGSPSSIRIVSINLFYQSASPLVFLPDWVPNAGGTFLTIPRENRYIGEGFPTTGIQPEIPEPPSRSDQIANPFK